MVFTEDSLVPQGWEWAEGLAKQLLGDKLIDIRVEEKPNALPENYRMISIEYRATATDKARLDKTAFEIMKAFYTSGQSNVGDIYISARIDGKDSQGKWAKNRYALYFTHISLETAQKVNWNSTNYQQLEKILTPEPNGPVDEYVYKYLLLK